MKTKIWILLLAMLPLIAGCDELNPNIEDFAELDNILTNESMSKKPAITVRRLQFSPDYKTFVMTTQMQDDIGPYSLTDTSEVKIDVEETTAGLIKTRKTQPRLVQIRNLKGENVYKSGVKVLVLVNSTLSQAVLNRIRNYTDELSSILNHDNLYVAFMDGETVSETVLLTNYVLNHHFVKGANNFVYLYRSIYDKEQEMLNHHGVWADAKKMSMLVFSDEKLYNNDTDEPLDPNHYQQEEMLLASDSIDHPDFAAYFACMDIAHPSETNHEDNVLKFFCQNHNGLFMNHYVGNTFKNHMLSCFHINKDANELIFENPNGKVYRGEHQTLTVNFLNTKNDSLIASVSTVIQEGSIYSPIIVHGNNIRIVILQGITLGAILILFLWALFQFIIPFIRYRIFLHKYVVRYTGGNMGKGKTIVQQACYLCKQPFEAGDEVVVKCDHTMHKTCWDENEYHCPEYSDRCKHGSHYYNISNLLDRNNASYYMKWILMAILAAMIAWIFFLIKVHFMSFSLNSSILMALYGLSSNSPEAQSVLREHIITHMPAFGFHIGLFLTFGIASLSLHLRNVSRSIKSIVIRSLIAAVGCYLVFTIGNIIAIILDIEEYSYIIDWIPWAVSGYLISFCGTYGTRGKLPRWLILFSVITGFLSMHLWSLFFFSRIIDFRVMLLFSFIIFAVGIAASIAMSAPRSERYFLKVQGAIKEMDVALYKWLRNNPNRVVTIGKSVDCSLQLSWDINGYVAPKHAEICLKEQTPYLTALEEGIFFEGEALVSGQTVRLYHGKSFTIGNTTFTYIEKDM